MQHVGLRLVLLGLTVAVTTQIAACTTSDHKPDTQVTAVTQNGYDFGTATYYVATRREVPRDWGDAEDWYNHAREDGYTVSNIPKKGAIAWTGNDDNGNGRVAYVEDVSADGKMVTISEMNYNGNWNRVTTLTVVAASFKYIS